MHDILTQLGSGQSVLDLGSGAHGSYRDEDCTATSVRCDLCFQKTRFPHFVCSDGRHLPFAAESFDAVILNHSLEHFPQPALVLAEIRRILRRPGYLWVAVPDSSTISDRLYRWISRGGGHVNQFSDRDALVKLIEEKTSLPKAGVRLLFSSYSFLNRRSGSRGYGRRIYLFGGGAEWYLRLLTLLCRKVDKYFRTRLSVYGWGCCFGPVTEFSSDLATNVCIRCGAGFHSNWLIATQQVRRNFLRIPAFRCPGCGARNYLTHDRDYSLMR